MNGAECGTCGYIQCKCGERILKRKRDEAIRNGQATIEAAWQVIARLPHWKIKILRWFWPDVLKVIDAMKEYYWYPNK